MLWLIIEPGSFTETIVTVSVRVREKFNRGVKRGLRGSHRRSGSQRWSSYTTPATSRRVCRQNLLDKLGV